ncbi:MAG: 16S rRNA (cytosine(967)-C(5))-methyltransferase RsmB [Ruminococcus sp.]|nr:16S rRNA (cytosine(967)-C(5))-methyltransferase RsmB [Ruminococcus sp.]
MGRTADPRYTAVKLLCRTLGSGGYSNLQLSAGLDSSGLAGKDRRLCSALYYGVIERCITLDHIISGLSSRPISKLDDEIINILRSGLYQLLYMDSIPDSAAVSESVRLSGSFGKKSAGGFVNALLRSFIRSGKQITMPEGEIPAMSVRYSVPEETAVELCREYGSEGTARFLELSLLPPVTYLRLNPLRCGGIDELSAAMEGIRLSHVSGSCCAAEGGDVTATEAFSKGFFHVQDISSQLCCEVLAPAEGDTVLDICAAPGGKTFTMAELMGGKGKICAFDLHEKRVGLIRSGAERLGLENIIARAGDASVFDPEMPRFTRILCDAPCSGLGVIRRKPEIKYKPLSELGRLPEIQLKIAENALRYLAPGGVLVYSTCTVLRDENDGVIERLLKDHPELELLPVREGTAPGTLTLLPGRDGWQGDGFFIAKLCRKY